MFFESAPKHTDLILGHADIFRHENIVVDDSKVGQVVNGLDTESQEERLVGAESCGREEFSEHFLALHGAVKVLVVVQILCAFDGNMNWSDLCAPQKQTS